MRQKSRTIFLYAGLSFLFAAFAVKWTGCPVALFRILFGTAVALKTMFLISVFRTKGFKPDMGVCMIMTGVAMILLYLVLKELSLVPILQKILFYGAITLKIAGLAVTVYRKKRL